MEDSQQTPTGFLEQKSKRGRPRKPLTPERIAEVKKLKSETDRRYRLKSKENFKKAMELKALGQPYEIPKFYETHRAQLRRRYLRKKGITPAKGKN